ncbi:MAG: LysM peptidoglycan-binding domain-containing protein [Cyclobacteriaceae bacterium]
MIKLLILITFSWNANVPADSMGMETIDGKTFVIHKVDQKETLFAISRRYRTTVDAILQYNTSASSGLEIGQILKVPYTYQVVNRAVDGRVHKVAPKETLYSISRIYQVSMEDIRQWNNLRDNTLSIGQALVIKKSSAPAAQTSSEPVRNENPQPISKKGFHTVGSGETLFSISKLHGVTLDQLKAWNNLGGNDLTIGQTLYVSQPERGAIGSKPDEIIPKTAPQPVVKNQEPSVIPPAPTVKNTSTTPKPEVREKTQSAESIRISESIKNGDEIIEGGLAELIEGTEGNRKYLALHRSAPMGTILKVRNEMNNREVFVRVMGKLPDTALTNKLIIKISKSAYDRLGAIDPRFRVEVTYYK